MINERQGLYMALINTINVTPNERKDVRYDSLRARARQWYLRQILTAQNLSLLD